VNHRSPPTIRKARWEGGHDGHAGHDHAGDLDGPVLAADLADEVVPKSSSSVAARVTTRRSRWRAGERDLGDEAVAHAQQAVGVGGGRHRQVALGDADGEAADQVDGGDDDGGDGVTRTNLAAPSMAP